jgi:hypothetical protein
MLIKEEQKNVTGNTTFLNIKEGAIVRRTAKGEERYSSLLARVTDIVLVNRTFNKEQVEYWYINLEDEEGSSYSLGFAYANNLFKSIILQLASEQGIEATRTQTPIKFSPYNRNFYDKVQLYVGENKLAWVIPVTELPEVKEIEVAGKRIKDDSARMELIKSYVEKIKIALNK